MPFPLHALLASCLALGACTSDLPADTALAAPPAAPAAAQTDGPYRFGSPVARFEMPDALREISALTVLDATHLGAVQDEDGDFYILDMDSGRVSAVIPFGPPGDYEGVELAGERLFVLRADGALLELTGWAAGQQADARTFDTGLGAKDCDAEGLGYDAAQNRLLIACKKNGDDDRNPIWGFDLATNALSADPVLMLDPATIPGSDKKLRPSALAVHPITGNTVVISAKRDALVALDARGAVVGTWDLKPAGLPQPEGLTFLPNGDAFVASEGKDGAGVVVRFAYEP